MSFRKTLNQQSTGKCNKTLIINLIVTTCTEIQKSSPPASVHERSWAYESDVQALETFHNNFMPLCWRTPSFQYVYSLCFARKGTEKNAFPDSVRI